MANVHTRREFLSRSAASMAAMSAASHLRAVEQQEEGVLEVDKTKRAPAQTIPQGKARHCIYIWLGGGPCQVDTWDPKRLGDPKKKDPGSYYPAIDTAIKGEKIVAPLGRCAPLMDRFVLVRTMHHNVIDEHAAAVNRMHTGRPVSGTIVYPSIGSIVAHEKPAPDNVPSYVVMGYPNVTRGPGFLGAQYSYLYLIDTESGPAALSRPETLTPDRVDRRQHIQATLKKHQDEPLKADKAIADYEATLRKAAKLSGPGFMSLFNLKEESASLRQSYGGELGQRCLLARRLIQQGVSFVEVAHNLNFVNGTGWDVHNEGILKQYLLLEELDMALSTLVKDLEEHKLLDKTLIVVAGEFGRPADFDSRGGRGHYGKCFSVAMAGGGIKTGQVIGQTDELGMKTLADPVGVPDLFATVFNTLGIKCYKELKDGERPVPITDQGYPIARLFV